MLKIFFEFEVKLGLDFLLTNVAHALGVACEALEELSDAAAVTSIEDTLVLHQKERNNDLDQLRGINFIYFMTFINWFIKNT